jgi:hypothetical protein
MFVGSRAWPVRRADNLTTIYEPIVRQCEILTISQPYRPPRPVMVIASLFYIYLYYLFVMRQLWT